jgi:tetratricopeptide (TPR) repeat protein
MESSATAQVKTSLRPKRRAFRLTGIFAAVAVAVILYLIFQPFHIRVGPDRAAIAQENSLAVMYFENLVDPEDADKTGQMVTALLITDLSESEYMRVLSRQRLYDILARLGEKDQKVIDRSVVSRVAEEAGVKWILTGTVLQIKPQIVLASEISDAETGEILASQRVDGEVGEGLFAVIDKLTVEVREDMSLPEEAKTEEDRQIADVTTHSQEAYRHYLDGLDFQDKYYDDEAEVSFRKAVEHDSTFAMALYSLSTVTVGDERRDLMGRALRHSANASRAERYHIEAYEAFERRDYEEAIRRLQRIIDIDPDSKDTHFTMALIYYARLGKPGPGIYHCKRVLEIDPLYKPAYNQMAYAYHQIGDHDSSLWAINKYIALAPDEPNPYDTRGDLYAYAGRTDQALASYLKADEIKPGFSTLKIGHMHLFEGRYAQAESCYKVMAAASDKWDRSKARAYLAIVPLYQGKFEDALTVIDAGIGADQMEQTLRRYSADKYRLAANIHLALEAYDAAVTEALNSRDILVRAYPDNPAFIADFYVHVLARTGRIEEAEETLRDLESRIEEEALDHVHTYWVIKGNIARAKGHLDEAIVYFEKGLEVAPDPYFHIRSMLGEAYLEAGRLDQAVATLEKALLRHDAARVLSPVRAVKAYYSLGLAYEKSGWTSKAIEQYETFLDIWKEADPGIPAVEDARRRLAHLKSGA